MVQFDFGNKQFTEWLLSFDIDRRSQLLTKVQQQLAQMGLRADQMQRALQQICQRTAVQVHRLPEDITMYMQRNRDHYERSKYSDNNHPFRPVGREYFKWKNDHQSSSLQRRMKNKQRFCYSYDNEERRQMVNYQQNNLRERYYYEEEAVLSRKVPSLGRSLIDRTELSLPEGENSIQRTQKYRNCTKTRYFKDTKCKLIHFVETNGNKSEKKQVSYVEKCAKSVNCNTNIISTKLQKTDSVEIDTKNVNKLTNSTKTKKQILSSNKSTNKNVETSSLYNVTTDTEVFKKHTDQDDASDKVLETIASAEKIVSDNLVPSEEGHSLPSDIKLMNSNTNIGPYQSVSLHQNCALTSKSEVKNKSVSNFSNAHCSGSEIRSPLSFESSEHKTLPSSDTAFESVLSSTSHCSEDRKRSLGIGSRIKDGADSVRIVGTPARATTTTNNSKVISKCLTDSVKKTSPQCYTTIDEYYNFKAKRSDKEVSSNTSSTYLGGSGFKTHCSSRTQSTNCNSKDLFKATSSNQNKRGEVKTLNSAVKSNFQQELDRISKPRGMVVGTSDFDVLDNKKRKENKTHQHVSKKKRGIGSESPLDKELAISEVKASKELAISEVSNPLNNPYSRIKEIPQVTNVTLKHGLLSVQRRSSTPASSSSDKFKRKRSHSYDGEQSNLFRQVDILKEDNAPISKVKKNVSKEESLAAISTALKEKEHKKVVPLDNNTQAKKFYSQSAPSQKNKLFVLKDRSKRTVPYYSDNLSTKKRKKIIDLFGEEDFEDPAIKELNKSDEKSQILQNESEQSSEQSKNEQQNMTSESLVNPLPKSIHQNKNTETLNKMADNECPSVIKSSLDCIPETIIGTKIIPAIKELSKSDEKSQTLQNELEQSSEQSKNEQQNVTSESIIGTKVIPAMKELSKSDEKSQTLQNELEQSSEQSKNEQQNMTSKSLVNPLPEKIHQNKNTEPLNKMADNKCPSVINSALDYIPETIIGTKIIPAIKELSKSDEKSRTLQTESEQSSEQSKNEQQNMTSKSLVNPLPESIHQNRNTETLNKMADNECPSVINSALDYIPETIIGTKVIPAIKELSKSDEKSQTLQTESEQFSEQSKNEQQNMTSKSLVNQLPESIHQNKNTETLNKMADNECPSVIKDALDYIPETIMGTKVIAEDIEVKVEINMDTIPLLFPGPQDGIPSIVKCDSEKETEKNKDTVDNEKQTTLQSTSSISDTTVALLDRCEKNKQPSFSAEDNRHLESLVVQDTLQSEMINTLDSDSNITKDPLDINKQIPETSKVIETSDPGIKKSIVTGVSENNHIEENSMLQNMEDSANNMVNNRINVILSSHFPEKTLVTSSVFQRNISHVSSASTTSNEKCAHSDNFQTFNTNDSVTTRPVCDRQLCHSKEGIIEPLQHPQASTNEFQNHAIINPCDNQVVKSTSEVVQMDSNPSALSAVPTCRIRVRDPAYLGISANYSKTSSYDKTSNVSLINADPTKNETTQSFSFPAMDKNLQQLAEITYTMLHDKDRCLERIKAANSLTSLTDIKSSEKDFAKRDFFLSLLRKVEIYCKLLTTVNMGMGNETETILLCRVNSISKEKKYTLHDVKEMKAMALEMENKRLKKKNSNNEAPRLLAAHPHLDSNVSTRPVPSIASQNAVSIQISHNPNSNNALSSSHEIGRIAPQPCSNKTTESVSQIQSNIVQNVQNRSNQVFDGNSVRPPPPLYISHSSSQRNFQKPETSPGRTTTQNTAGHPPPPYPVYSITHITNHQNQPILNSSYQQNSAPPSGIFNNSIVQPTQKNHQGFPHPTPHRSTANTYHHKPMAPQIGFKNSSVNTLYQQKQVQLTSSCPKQSIIPNITVNQQNQVLQQTPLHGSLVQTPSQQKQIPQMGCGSALHSSNQLSYQHHNNIHASQYPANNYKDMQSGVQHPSRHQPLVHALLAAGSCLTVPSYQNLGKMCHKQQDQQLRIEQKLPQIQKPANPSSAFPVLPQIRSHQHLLQFYQQYQNQQHEKVSQHQNKQQESLQPQEQPHLRQFQQSLSYLELGQRQHQPIQIQQNELQQHRHQLEKHQAKKRCIKEQMQQTHKQHQQEQLQPIRHQQEHLLQSQRHQQGQLIHPQQWHKQSQLQQCTQKKLKQQYQLEQMQFSQQNQQGLVHQIQHQQEQFQQNHQLPPPPDLLRLQSQSQKESQLLPISLRHMERMVYDNLNYGRQLQSNSLSPNLTEVAPNAIAHSQNSVLHQMSNLKNASNIGATRQNSLGTKFQQNTETINQVLTKSQTSIYQSVQHPTTNSNLQQSPPQSDTSTSLVPAIIPAKQKQLASCLSSESCKGISDNYLHARRLVPEVVKEQATINIPNSDVHENARRLVPEVIKEQATINIPNSDVHENARRLVPEVVKEKATINIPNSHVHENISTLCPLDNVPNLGKDNPMKNATFNNNNKHISSENERESTGPEILHSEQMTSNSEYQPPLESEITLSGLLRSGVEYFSTMIDSHITDKHKQLKMRGKQISDTSIDDQRPVPEVTREQVTENLDDIVANVGNCDFNTEENNSKQSKQIDNGNIDAAVIASHSFSQLQTREKRCISSKSKANSTNTIKANPTMSSEGESQSKIVIVNKHCDRISTESVDIMEIAIKPNDEPTMQNCKKPKEGARGQRDMPSLDDIGDKVICSPLNDCMPIDQDDVDIEVIGEFLPQLRTLSRDSGYTTPTTFAIKEDDNDVMLFEEETVKIEDHSENMNFYEINKFEDQESNQALSKDIKSCFETEEMELPSSSSDDTLYSRIKIERGGLIYMELDKDSCCAVCEDSAQVMCSGCKSVTYCSETCQVKDWKEGHYLVCLGSCSDT